MDVREKLVELINDCRFMEGYGMDLVERQADHLIANGVTVQEWISVDERLPEDRGYYLVACRDKYNESTSIALDYYVQCGAGEWWANEFTHNITHWMPIPEPHRAEPITNADRIRSMTDEELALWICGVYDIEEENGKFINGIIIPGYTPHDIEEWLQRSTVEGERWQV